VNILIKSLNYKKLKDCVHENALLVPAYPYDGCSSLLNGPDIKNNIALIIRGECSFLSKSINAEKAGAIAVIITDNQNDIERPIQMITDETDRVSNIPSLYLSFRDGSKIKESIDQISGSDFDLRAAVINIPINITLKKNNFLRKAPWSYW
jgi:hypothetical protein